MGLRSAGRHEGSEVAEMGRLVQEGGWQQGAWLSRCDKGYAHQQGLGVGAWVVEQKWGVNAVGRVTDWWWEEVVGGGRRMRLAIEWWRGGREEVVGGARAGPRWRVWREQRGEAQRDTSLPLRGTLRHTRRSKEMRWADEVQRVWVREAGHSTDEPTDAQRASGLGRCYGGRTGRGGQKTAV